MKIMIIGATGTIGSAISDLMSLTHEVIRVGNTGGDLQVDLADKASIEALFEASGTVQAVVSAAGQARFGPFEALTDEDFESSFHSKLMGQANLIRVGAGRVSEGGSFTLTTGNLSQDPIPGSAAVSMAGGGLESFAKAAALELSGRYRVNVVSPGWVKETMVALGMDPTPGMSASDLAHYYARVVSGDMTGQIIDPTAD